MFLPSVHDLARPLQGAGYQFWSGVESAIQAAAEKALYAAVFLVLWWRKHNCHEPGCLRWAWHPDLTGHPVCKVHHPDHPARGWWRR